MSPARRHLRDPLVGCLQETNIDAFACTTSSPDCLALYTYLR